MGSSTKTEYCALTQAVEHLGDRWSLLIVRELALFGPQGFNTLATGLPGHVSRSVLTEKLRKLEEIGIVARDPSVASRSAPYCLTPAGEQLMPTLKWLWGWAEPWVLIGEDRYVFVEADAGALYPIARGSCSWTDAMADGSVRIYGKPDVVAALPGWFLPVERDEDARSDLSLPEPELAIEVAA